MVRRKRATGRRKKIVRTARMPPGLRAYWNARNRARVRARRRR